MFMRPSTVSPYRPSVPRAEFESPVRPSGASGPRIGTRCEHLRNFRFRRFRLCQLFVRIQTLPQSARMRTSLRVGCCDIIIACASPPPRLALVLLRSVSPSPSPSPLVRRPYMHLLRALSSIAYSSAAPYAQIDLYRFSMLN